MSEQKAGPTRVICTKCDRPVEECACEFPVRPGERGDRAARIAERQTRTVTVASAEGRRLP